MEKKIDIDSLLEKNKKIDKSVFKEINEYLKNLKENGIEEQQYNISSPFSENFLKVKEDTNQCKVLYTHF